VAVAANTVGAARAEMAAPASKAVSLFAFISQPPP
jgi:hypothetical protein